MNIRDQIKKASEGVDACSRNVNADGALSGLFIAVAASSYPDAPVMLAASSVVACVVSKPYVADFLQRFR